MRLQEVRVHGRPHSNTHLTLHGAWVKSTRVKTLLTITLWGFYMRGTRLRARETGGLSMVPGGGRIAPVSLTQLRSLAQRGCGTRPDRGRASHTARRVMKSDLYSEVSARIVA